MKYQVKQDASGLWAVIAPSGRVAGLAPTRWEAERSAEFVELFVVGKPITRSRVRSAAEMTLTRCGVCERPISPSKQRPAGVKKQAVIGRCWWCHRTGKQLRDARVRKSPAGACVVSAGGDLVREMPSMEAAYAWVSKYQEAA